jgi:hypothetical protein
MFRNPVELAPKVYNKIEFWRNYLFDTYQDRHDFQYRVNLYGSLWYYLNRLSPASATEILDNNEYLMSVENLFDITYLSGFSIIDNVSFIYVTDIRFHYH